jgi:hypothetical protein
MVHAMSDRKLRTVIIAAELSASSRLRARSKIRADAVSTGRVKRHQVRKATRRAIFRVEIGWRELVQFLHANGYIDGADTRTPRAVRAALQDWADSLAYDPNWR